MKRAIAVSALSSLLLTACGSKDTVSIGYIGPLTGEAASYGVDTLHGVQMAVEEINAQGGINGKQVKLIAEDARCNGTDAASAVQKLVAIDGVPVIIGGQCSGETLAAAPIVEKAQVLLLSPLSSSPDVTTAGAYVFRNYPSDALKTKAVAQLLQQKGWGKVALLSENTDFAQAFRTSLKNDVGDKAIIFDEVVEPGTKDFRTLMTRLQTLDFDLFFPNAQSDAVMGAMIQQLREVGLTQQILSHDVGDSLTLIDLAKDAVEGMFVVNVPTAGEGGTFEKQFTEKFSTPQATLAFAAHAYDAAKIVLQAVTAGATDGPALKTYLDDLAAYEGITGTFSFDDNGDVVGIPYGLKQFQGGKIVQVEEISVE